MSIAEIDRIKPQSPEQYLLMEHVSWDFYDSVLRETGDSGLRITFDQGRIEILSPTMRHERRKKILGMFVELIALEREIPMCRLGSTTIRRKDLLIGLEPDECFYVQNAGSIGTRDELDLSVDPPPDLAIEVDVAHRSVAREPVYASLGVNELWRHDGLSLSFRKLDPATRIYRDADTSSAFPFLLIADLTPFLEMLVVEEETAVLRRFRDWVRQHM